MMNEFMYGKTYIVKRTETTIEAFELLSRGKDFIEVYIREYTPETNELIGYEVRLHVKNDGFQEFVSYKKDIPASQHYQGDLCIYTKQGVASYDEKNQKDFSAYRGCNAIFQLRNLNKSIDNHTNASAINDQL